MTKKNEPMTLNTSTESPSQSQQLSEKHSCSENNRTKPILHVQHDYHDYASVPDDDVPVDCVSQYQKKHKGGIDILFPEKLHQILSDDSGDVISWASHGRCFFIHDRDKMLTNYLKPRFGINTYASFQRQLNRYLFKLITKKGSRDAGAYYHERFLRGRPRLCQRIRGRKFKSIFMKPLPNPNCEPDFYRMPPCIALTKDADGIVDNDTNREEDCGSTANCSGRRPGDYNPINANPLTASPQADSEQTSLHRSFSQSSALETSLHVQESSVNSSTSANKRPQPLPVPSGALQSLTQENTIEDQFETTDSTVHHSTRPEILGAYEVPVHIAHGNGNQTRQVNQNHNNSGRGSFLLMMQNMNQKFSPYTSLDMNLSQAMVPFPLALVNPLILPSLPQQQNNSTPYFLPSLPPFSQNQRYVILPYSAEMMGTNPLHRNSNLP